MLKRCLILTLCFSPYMGIAYQDPHAFPQGCRQVNYHFRNHFLILDTDAHEATQPQTLYLIHNVSNAPIQLQLAYPKKYFPTYTKHIPYGSWAAFAKDTHHIVFACLHAVGRYAGYLESCQNVIRVCNYNNAKFPPHNVGTYWFERTGSKREVMHYAIRKGVLLRW